jgi:hypothetical protein
MDISLLAKALLTGIVAALFYFLPGMNTGSFIYIFAVAPFFFDLFKKSQYKKFFQVLLIFFASFFLMLHFFSDYFDYIYYSYAHYPVMPSLLFGLGISTSYLFFMRVHSSFSLKDLLIMSGMFIALYFFTFHYTGQHRQLSFLSLILPISFYSPLLFLSDQLLWQFVQLLYAMVTFVFLSFVWKKWQRFFHLFLAAGLMVTTLKLWPFQESPYFWYGLHGPQLFYFFPSFSLYTLLSLFFVLMGALMGKSLWEDSP